MFWFIFTSIIVGALAGFIAGKLTRGSGFGFWLNLIIGILGGFLGWVLFAIIGFHADSILAQLIVSTIGAIILLWLINKIRK